MRREQDLERFEQSWRRSGALEDLIDLALVRISHRGNDSLLVLEIPINKADTDAGFGAYIVHTGLMKTALGEANHAGMEDLLATIRDSGRRGI
jgi:hypothetical protein